MAPSKISIAAVGDLVPTHRLWKDGKAVSPGFAKAVAVLQASDIVFGNLEAPLATSGHPREKFITFRSDPVLAADLRAVGFDVICLANNHSMDYGPEALLETIDVLARQGVACVGAGATLDEALRPVVIEKKGWRIGFIAWSCLLPAGSAAAANRPGHSPMHVRTSYEINPYIDMEEPGNPPRIRTWVDPSELASAIESVAALRPKVDFLVASMHWGFGSGTALAEYQPFVGHALIDAGADVVVGHHVHTLHAVESYKGKAILYSSGGFIAQQPREGQSAFILSLLDTMSPDAYAAVLDVVPGSYSVRLFPMRTIENGLPVPAEGSEFDRIGQLLDALSAPLGARVTSGMAELDVRLS
jgi:poly-gamma-glutamate synthesis protein (capsule biosynthesis protein)